MFGDLRAPLGFLLRSASAAASRRRPGGDGFQRQRLLGLKLEPVGALGARHLEGAVAVGIVGVVLQDDRVVVRGLDRLLAGSKQDSAPLNWMSPVSSLDTAFMGRSGPTSSRPAISRFICIRRVGGVSVGVVGIRAVVAPGDGVRKGWTISHP